MENSSWQEAQQGKLSPMLGDYDMGTGGGDIKHPLMVKVAVFSLSGFDISLWLLFWWIGLLLFPLISQACMSCLAIL